MPSHISLMAIFALILSLFFAVLWRRERKEQVKVFLQLFLGLMLGALILAWIMYPYPPGPPTTPP